jgi:IS30 family transposase
VLLHLPARHTAEAVRDALADAMSQLPEQLRRSLYLGSGQGDGAARRGRASAGHAGVLLREGQPLVAASNENTNGLMREYFPKGSDLRVHGSEDLAAVAAELNDRPRKTLGWATPAERLEALLRGGAD